MYRTITAALLASVCVTPALAWSASEHGGVLRTFTVHSNELVDPALNLRQGPSSAYSIIAIIYNGQQVQADRCINPVTIFQLTGQVVTADWCHIRWNSYTGWVNANYLVEITYSAPPVYVAPTGPVYVAPPAVSTNTTINNNITNMAATPAPATPVSPVPAPVASNQCIGVLFKLDEDLVIGPAKGDEGICRIKKYDVSNVLRGCTIGQSCMVTGSIDLCEDSGECIEISHVTQAKSRQNMWQGSR